MTKAAASHGRVEYARQQLVNAEEAYLRAHGWGKLLVGNFWLWATMVAGEKIIMQRTEAVHFQHQLEEAGG